MNPALAKQVERLFCDVAELDEAERNEYLRQHATEEESENVLDLLSALTEAEQSFFLASNEIDLSRSPTQAMAVGPTEEQEVDYVGQLFESRYRIQERLGKGGFAFVYCARDERLHGRTVVVKVPRHAAVNEMWTEKIVRNEIAALAAIDHPGVIGILDTGRTPDARPFVVTQFVSGQTLREALSQGPMDVQRVVRLLRQLGSALQTAHDRGVWHHDVKPENIALRKFARNEEHAVLLDFGIARVLEGQREARASRRPVGTPAYMAPEQYLGSPTAATDTFALGLVVFEMLTAESAQRGRRWLETDKLETTLRKRLIALRPELPPAVRALIAKATAPKPRDRFSRVMDFTEEFADAVLHWAKQPQKARKPRPVRVAVMPFLNENSDDEAALFCLGMTDELIGALGRVQGLKVAGRSLVFPYRGKNYDPRDVARDLGVGYLLEGSVRKAKNRLRISTQLLQGRDGFEVWSETFDRSASDIFDVQDEVSRAVCTKLLKTSALPLRIVRKQTDDMDAYRSYLQGRYHSVAWFTEEGLRRALHFFLHAKELDPGYVHAYAGAADMYGALAVLGYARSSECRPLAESEMLKAMELDDQLSESHAAMAYFRLWQDWKWEEAERHYRRAIELDPANANCFGGYAELLGMLGRNDECLASARYAVDLEPVSVNSNRVLAAALVNVGRYREATRQSEKMMELNPAFFPGYWYETYSRFLDGDGAGALRAIERAKSAAPDNPLTLGILGWLYGVSGRKDEARSLVQNLIHRRSSGYFPPSVIAPVFVGLGEFEQAIKWLNQAYTERDPMVAYVKASPPLWPLKPLAGFRALLRRLGIPED